jgi:hypothetical protein
LFIGSILSASEHLVDDDPSRKTHADGNSNRNRHFHSRRAITMKKFTKREFASRPSAARIASTPIFDRGSRLAVAGFRTLERLTGFSRTSIGNGNVVGRKLEATGQAVVAEPSTPARDDQALYGGAFDSSERFLRKILRQLEILPGHP